MELTCTPGKFRGLRPWVGLAQMAAVAQHVCQPGFLARFKPQELANTAWAFAKLNVRHTQAVGSRQANPCGRVTGRKKGSEHL